MNLGKYIKRHEYSADHLHCKDKSENFIAIAQGKKHDVVSMLSSAFARKIERNREILKSILKVIVLCGRQHIALRGHTEEKSNFMALVNFRAETNLILAEHLKQSPPNSRYLSPQIQNELIELCGNQIRDNIIKATGYDYPHLPGLGNNDEKLGLPERLSTVQEPISRKKIG